MDSHAVEIAGLNGARPALASRYAEIRRFTERLREPLAVEDCVIQSMPDVSPTKWHLGHTTWFFENFVAKRSIPGYRVFNPAFDLLFNSYYNAEGPQFPRPERGLLSRPTVEEVLRYRAHVDERMIDFLSRIGSAIPAEVADVVELGLQHEQQHQELLLTDIKHVLSLNPLRPAYRSREEIACGQVAPLRWLHYPEGIFSIGAKDGGFAFDNERPRHNALIPSFALAMRPVTNGEFIAFIRDGGYANPLLWLSLGWAAVREKGWRAPLYWEERDGEWWTMTLGGPFRVSPSEPVCHISYFEADAYARWAGARLATELEWERAARGTPGESHPGNFVEDERFHPAPVVEDEDSPGALRAMLGSVWEWTSSAYSPYPGFAPPPGALGEYNGKFMCNQYVLRGGSCATHSSHVRTTYRNFFPPEARWQFSGVRLARGE